MSELKKPAKITTDDAPKESKPDGKDQAENAEPNKIIEQANPEEVPPLPDDDKEFDREPEKRLE